MSLLFRSIQPVAILLLASGLAQGTELHFTGSSGGVLTPWNGTIDGEVRIAAHQVNGSTQTWVREGDLVALPPIPQENWFPALTHGRQAMYQLVKFCVDLLLAVDMPEHPSALGALTGNFYTAQLIATNADFGIEATCEAMVTGGETSRAEGTFTVTVDAPFPYCTNAYLTRGTVYPDGPGAAVLNGLVHLNLEDGTEMDLMLSVRYGFDPALTLPNAYIVTEAASYQIVEEPVQTLHVVETYSERLLEPTPVPGAAALTALTGVQPNPFNPRTTITFTLAAPQQVDVAVFSLDGRRVATLAAGPRAAGVHRVAWQGGDDRGQVVPSGVYVCRLQAGAVVQARRVTLLK